MKHSLLYVISLMTAVVTTNAGAEICPSDVPQSQRNYALIQVPDGATENTLCSTQVTKIRSAQEGRLAAGTYDSIFILQAQAEDSALAELTDTEGSCARLDNNELSSDIGVSSNSNKYQGHQAALVNNATPLPLAGRVTNIYWKGTVQGNAKKFPYFYFTTNAVSTAAGTSTADKVCFIGGKAFCRVCMANGQ